MKYTKTKIFAAQRSKEVIDDDKITQPSRRTQKDLNAILLALNNTALVSETDWLGDITYANDKFVEISKYSREELIGQNHRILKSGYHTPQFYMDLWGTIISGKVWRGKIKNRAKDGTYYWVDTSIAPILGKDGKPRKYISVRFPITEQMELQEKLEKLNTELEERILLRTEELKKSEEHFRDLTDSMPQLVWTANPDGIVDYYNDKYKEYEGIKKRDRQFIWSSVVHPDDSKNTVQAWKKAVSNGVTYEVEHRVKVKNGKFRWHLSRGVPLKNKKGKIIKWYGTATDIHEQKESEYRFITTLKNSPIIVSQADSSARYLWIFNPQPLINPEDVIGKTDREIADNEGTRSLYELKNTVLQTGITTTREIDFPIEGKTVSYSITAEPLMEGGKVVGVTTVAVDITARKKFERQKDEFLGVASHELKTPVTSVKAYTQVMKTMFQRKGDEKSVMLLQKMDSQLNKLIVLIGDLLDSTKIQSGKLQLRSGYFDFNELVNEVVSEMQLTTDKHQIIKELDRTKTVYGDRDRIGQVIVNFLSNAIKYSPNAKTINIKSNAIGREVILCTQDFGVGIPREKVDHVFERFYRVEGHGNETYPGLGLGLFISSEIIKRHNGRIWAESKRGKGSTFCFSLPTKIDTQQG